MEVTYKLSNEERDIVTKLYRLKDMRGENKEIQAEDRQFQNNLEEELSEMKNSDIGDLKGLLYYCYECATGYYSDEGDLIEILESSNCDGDVDHDFGEVPYLAVMDCLERYKRYLRDGEEDKYFPQGQYIPM